MTAPPHVATAVASADAAASDEAEQTCGQELARDADVPDALARLMDHVAKNMDAHARWVGASPSGGLERDGLERVAAAYRALAASAVQAGDAMRAMKDVPAVPHDPAHWDRAAQASWMREKVSLQREFAAIVLRHADVSEAVLAMWEGRSAGASEGK